MHFIIKLKQNSFKTKQAVVISFSGGMIGGWSNFNNCDGEFVLFGIIFFKKKEKIIGG